MFDEETLRLLARAQWGATDLHQQMELTPEERDAADQLAEQILILADEHYTRTKARSPEARKRYFIAGIARAMAGANALAQIHANDEL
jgi:hypothetical protein